MIIQTDASVTGWRVVCQGKTMWNMACEGTELTYKHSRVVSSEASTDHFNKEMGNDVDAFANRKHNNFKLPIENWRNKEREAHRFKQ